MNEIKSAVVAGNGPSLAKIDYDRLPKDFDVFRCNQFYFEDKYFLGKKVKYAFMNFSVILEQYLTYKTLCENKEYLIENIVISRLAEKNTDKKYQGYHFYFPDIQDGYDLYISKLKDFNVFLKFNNLYKSNYITSGVYMTAVAVALGYKRIYVAGIDFYESSENDYAFNHKKNNLIKIVPNMKLSAKNNIHKKMFDIEALRFLVDKYEVEIFSLCPSSKMEQYFPYNNVVSRFAGGKFMVNEKTDGATKDILIPIERAYLITGYSSSMLKISLIQVKRYYDFLLRRMKLLGKIFK